MRLLCFSDLHRSVTAARRLAERAVAEGVDALLSAGDLATDEDHDPAVYEALGLAGRPILAVPGNHDGEAYAAHFGRNGITDLDGRLLELGGLALAGWGIRWMDSSLSGPNRRAQQEDPVLRFVTDRLGSSPASRTILLTHLPPWGVRVGRDAAGIDQGNAQLRDWVEAFQPAAVVCGHVHHSGAMTSRLGNTTIVNGGTEGVVLTLDGREDTDLADLVAHATCLTVDRDEGP